MSTWILLILFTVSPGPAEWWVEIPTASAQACKLAIEDYARRTDFDRGRLSVMCVERKGDER